LPRVGEPLFSREPKLKLLSPAALAAGTEVGLHAAVQLGWIGGGGALLGVYGFASVMDACMDGPDQRFFARGGGEERPKE